MTNGPMNKVNSIQNFLDKGPLSSVKEDYILRSHMMNLPSRGGNKMKNYPKSSS